MNSIIAINQHKKGALKVDSFQLISIVALSLNYLYIKERSINLHYDWSFKYIQLLLKHAFVYTCTCIY